MPEIRGVLPHAHRSPSRPADPPASRRGADLVDVFARVLSGVVVTPATFRSETALAGQLRVDPRRIRDLRLAGLVAPTRLGRGWVYGPAEIRTLSVMLALGRLGASLRELTAFFEVQTRPGTGEDRVTGTPARACIEFCERLAARMAEEIARLGTLDALVEEVAPELLEAPDTSGKPL